MHENKSIRVGSKVKIENGQICTVHNVLYNSTLMLVTEDRKRVIYRHIKDVILIVL